MRKYMDMIIPAAVIGVLVLVFAMLIGTKAYANSMEAAERAQREANESVYLNLVKDELQAEGFSNCGVNMTKETNENGEWEYTVVVYHRSFEWMDETDAMTLEQKLENAGSDSLGKISLDLLVR
ncbi:MAG: hypothetical protein J6A80_01240 [Lachnospiraceae bacterium]|nr:hypothetical protein [Lachnospiraceae bacterium]